MGKAVKFSKTTPPFPKAGSNFSKDTGQPRSSGKHAYGLGQLLDLNDVMAGTIFCKPDFHDGQTFRVESTELPGETKKHPRTLCVWAEPMYSGGPNVPLYQRELPPLD